MADTFGLTEFPVDSTAEPIGDPGLAKVGAFVKAVINDRVPAAWSVLRPRTGDAALPVKNVLLLDPRKVGFSDAVLPALFIYRDKETQRRDADEWWTGVSDIHIWWVYPPDPRAKHDPRIPFANAIGKSVARALERLRDPAWVDEGDTSTAATVAASNDSFVLAHTTSTTARTLSGATLDGALGGSALTPRLGLVVHVAVGTEAILGDLPAGEDPPIGGPYPDNAPIVVTFLDCFGNETSESLYFTSQIEAQTLTLSQDMTQLISIQEPAFASPLGSLQYGNPTRVGTGSLLLDRSGFTALHMKTWQPVPIEVVVTDAQGRKADTATYYAVQMILEGLEVEEQDLDLQGNSPDRVTFTVSGRDDGFTTTEALPHS